MFLDIQDPRVFYKHERLEQTDCWNVVSDYFEKKIAKKYF